MWKGYVSHDLFLVSFMFVLKIIVLIKLDLITLNMMINVGKLVYILGLVFTD